MRALKRSDGAARAFACTSLPLGTPARAVIPRRPQADEEPRGAWSASSRRPRGISGSFAFATLWLRMTLVAIVVAVPPPELTAGEDRAAMESAVARAERTWDVAAAVEALSRARTLQRTAPSPANALLQVRAGLLAAELLRVDFEQARGTASPERDTLGQRIDAFAEEALALLPSLPASSERWRIEADLIATMIRSDFRAKKHETRLRAAIAEARRLDPGNARALVSEAKPFLFAPPERGRDVRAGVALLDQALALDPRLEPALLLRAFARDRLGERAAAEADWRAALELNPDCRPARDALGAPTPTR
jgi:hypothetical protein